MRARRLLVVVAILAMALLVGLLGAAPAGAVAPTSASCIGQFFSAHAGIVPATEGEESVGGFISEAAQELGAQFGADISGARTLPREDCGL